MARELGAERDLFETEITCEACGETFVIRTTGMWDDVDPRRQHVLMENTHACALRRVWGPTPESA